MTVDAFEKAINIKEQVKSISEILDILGNYTYECQPPTRMSNVDIQINDRIINLNEGELVAFKDALEARKGWLLREFGKL
jgi:hypothetical protein